MWAPRRERVEVVLDGRTVPLRFEGRGWHAAEVDGVGHGSRYLYRLDGGAERPDPASRSQPDGVHGPSEVIDPAYEWTDGGFEPPPFGEHVIYEMHAGTFTEEGTFHAAIDRLGHLTDLGVTAVEVMPIAVFPGARNWGYDGVALYAAHHAYGGLPGFQRFVDACHARGISVFLDVVYNHLGPEGNYLAEFGPYFTDRYRTPWGDAVNLDGPGSDPVRDFFIHNALMWVRDAHVDGFRLDAVHAIYDKSARHFLADLAAAVHEAGVATGKRVAVIAENDLNDPRVVEPGRLGGLGLDAAWNDDFHHALHVTVTGESGAYYADFAAGSAELSVALRDGYVNAGRHSPFRDHRVGAPSDHLPRSSLVVFSQNHDQIGNRPLGDRLSTLVDPAPVRLAAALTVLGPWVPMLFMGEEWAETNPFLYFVDHSDPDLVAAVREGRAEEFAGLFESGGAPPDPADPVTMERSRLDWTAPARGIHLATLRLYTDLIAVRRSLPPVGNDDPGAHAVEHRGTVIALSSCVGEGETLSVFNPFAEEASHQLPDGDWKLRIDGDDPRYGGDGRTRLGDTAVTLPPWGFALFERER